MTTDECECKREQVDYTITAAAATLGRKGGRAKTEKKAQAARENGKKGGRPKRAIPVELDPAASTPVAESAL